MWTQFRDEQSNISSTQIIELDNYIAGAEQGLIVDAKDCCLAAMEVLRMRGPMSLGIELTETFLKRRNLSDEVRLPIYLARANCLRISGRVQEAREETKIALELAEKLEDSSEEESSE